MVHADRYYYQTSSFKHKDFKSITYLIQDDLGSPKYKRYQVLNSLIVSFVNMVNHNNGDNCFEDLSNKLSEQGFANTSYLPSIPDLSDFKSMAYQSDYINLKSMYLNIIKQYSMFSISKNEIYNWGNNLRYYGYLNQSVQVYKLLIDLYPYYISAYNGLARTLLLQNNHDEAPLSLVMLDI